MGRLAEIINSEYAKKTTAPGKAVILKTKAGSITRNIELYHPPGISSAPTPADRVIETDAGGGVKVAIATHNYKLEIEVTAGETIIYSTDAAGETLKSYIKLDTDGNIDLNGDDDTVVKHGALNTLLQALLTALNGQLITAGAPGGLTLDLSTAEAATVRVKS